MRKLFMIAATALVVSSGFADTMYWWYTKTATANNWQSFGDANNWCIGTSQSSATRGQKIPTATDDFCYGANTCYFWFDLGGGDYTFRSVVSGDNDWDFHYLNLTNGTLTFTGDVTNTGFQVTIENSGKLVLGATSAGRWGRGGRASAWRIKSGGAADVYGEMTIHTQHITVDEGGVLNFAPPILYGSDTLSESNAGGAWIMNSGTVNLTNGLFFTKSTNSGHFRIYQCAGTMNLGGDICHTGSCATVDFYLSGGTLNVTDDAAIRALDPYYPRIYAYLTNDVTATVNVAAGKTMDFTRLTCGERTTLVKAGTGTLKLGTSKPAVLKVAADGAHAVAANTALGDMIQLESGSTLILGGAGISATSLTGLAGATVTLDSSVAGGSTVFTSTDAALTAAVAAKLNASSSALGGFTVVGSGIVYEKKHDSAIFAWANEGRVNNPDWRGGTYTWYDFMNPTSWKLGVAKATNADGLLPGENDDFFISDSYQPIFAMDMGGLHRKVRHLYRNLRSDGTYDGQAGFRQFNLRNGTLEFTGSFTNVRAEVVAKSTGKFIFGENSSSRLGYNGAQDDLVAEAGGEIDVYGAVEMHIINVTADAGGVIDFSPTSLGYYEFGASRVWNFTNNGTMKFGKGIVHTNTGSKYGTINYHQNAGTMILGGDLKKVGASNIKDYFYLNGGTLKAAADATLSGFTSIAMAENATATVEVESGKTLDLSAMTFAAGTTLNKTGEGTLVLGASQPATLNVNAGAIKFSAKVTLGNWVKFANGTTLKLSRFGCSATAIDNVDNINIVNAVEGGFGIVFESTDSTLLNTVLARLNAARREGENFTVNAGSIVYELSHDPTVFTYTPASGKVTDYAVFDFSKWSEYSLKSFFDPTTWAAGRSSTATNPDQLVPGADDWLFYGDESYQLTYALDLEGKSWSISGLTNGLDVTKNLWGFRYLLITNGTLNVTRDFTGTRWAVRTMNGGRFVHDTTCTSQFGNGDAQCYFAVMDGGTVDLKGNVSFISLQTKIDAGGTFNFEPSTFAANSQFHGGRPATYFENRGNFNLPGGFNLTGTGDKGNPGRVNLRQQEGTMTLGGSIAKGADVKGNVYLYLEGGTLKVTDDASVSGLAAFEMPTNAAATVEVAAGKSFDASTLDFAFNNALAKTGAGTLKLAANVPSNLTVSAGTLSCAGSALGAALTLGSGATLELAGEVSATAIAGLAGATVTVADSVNNSNVFTSSDSTLLSQVLEKLQAGQSADALLVIRGNSIWFEREHPATQFSWKIETVSDAEKLAAGFEQYWNDSAQKYLYDQWYLAREVERIVKLPHTPFVAAASWAVGTSPSGSNPDELIPLAGDSIFISNSYDPLFRMDLGGMHRQVLDYDKTGYEKERWGFNGFSITNGTLEFTRSFISTRSRIYAQNGGKMVFGSDSTNTFGKGEAECAAYAFAGGEIVYGGEVTFGAMLLKIYAGGKVTIDPNRSELNTPSTSYHNNYLDNSGTLSLPNGLILRGNGHDDKVFNVYNRAGATLELGGTLERKTVRGTFNFTLEGGTVKVTENAAITGFDSTTMASGTSVSIEVAEGKTLDLTEMTFESNTTVTNAGKGRIRFGASRPTAYVNPNARPSIMYVW